MDKTACNRLLEIAYYRAERNLCCICGTKIIGSRIHVIGLKKINLEKVDLPFHPKCYEPKQ